MLGIARGLIFVAALALAGCGGGGGASQTPPPPPAANNPPSVVMTMLSGVRRNSTTGATLATLGASIELSSTGTSDPDGDSLTLAWSIVSKPTGSAALLSSASGSGSNFTPDKLGDYVVSLTASDGKGGVSERRVTITADNQAPISAIAVTITFNPTPTVLPTQDVVVGSSIVMDASGSSDPNGDTLTHTWSIIEAPVGSAAALNSTNEASARFTPDRLGTFRVRARLTDGRGAFKETIAVFNANNQAPNPVVSTGITPRAGGTTNVPNISVGYELQLNAAGTSDPDGDAISYTWVLVAKPAGSVASLTAATGASTVLAPDLMGNYSVVLRAQDARGASIDHTIVVQVNNRRPTVALTTNAVPVPVVSVAPIRVPVGTEVLLDGGDSRDADGDTLSYSWTLVSKPAGSVATIKNDSSTKASFVPDVGGSYGIKLRATDSKGAFAEQSMIIDVGNYAPRAVLDKDRAVVVLGSSVSVTGSLSFDEDGDPLTFSWTLQSKPSGSSRTLASNASGVSFTPDVPGTYILKLVVGDGKQTATAYFTVIARASVTGAINLPFVPLQWQYSGALDVLVLTSDSPPSLRIVEPSAAIIRSVVLPLAPRALAVSANGKRAAILHGSAISYVNLETATLLRTVITGGDRTEVFLRNDGQAYVIGQVGGQWVSPPIQRFNLETGAELSSQSPPDGFGGAYFYGTQRGVFAPLKNKAFFVSEGLSPTDLSYFTVDALTGSLVGGGDSRYHGDFPISGPLFLNASQDIVFTGAGTYFFTASLTHAGTLSNLPGAIRSLSHSAEQDELLVIGSTFDYSDFPFGEILASSYSRYSSGLFSPQGSLGLPVLGGAQSFGIAVFHSSSGNHVMLVQTGNEKLRGAGASYHVVYR
jgi:hypothetical protein